MNIKNESNTKDLELKKFFKPEGDQRFIFDEHILINSQETIVFRLLIGQMYFNLNTDKKNNLEFIFTEPGIKGLSAKISLEQFIHVGKLFVEINWSRKETILKVSKYSETPSFISSIGSETDTVYFVDPANQEISRRPSGQSMHTFMPFLQFEGKKSQILSSAINMWNETKIALDELLNKEIDKISGHSKQLLIGMSLSTTITSFESYSKRRFVELENAGCQIQIRDIVKETYGKEQEEKEKEFIEKKSENIEFLILKSIVDEDKINFQIFNKCKEVFKKAYGIQFSELIQSHEMEFLKKSIDLRHRIIHYSPFIQEANFGIDVKKNPDNLLIPNKEYVKDVLKNFDEFIQKLHQKTLELL